jgi:hypothetical protein
MTRPLLPLRIGPGRNLTISNLKCLSVLRTTSVKGEVGESRWIASQPAAFDRSAHCLRSPADRKAHIGQHVRAKKLYPAHSRSGLSRAGSRGDQQPPNFSCSMYDLLPGTSCVVLIASEPTSSISLRRTFLLAETQQQCFKLIKRLLCIGPDGLQHDTVAAI